MSTTLPDASPGVNPQPGYYAIIPASVRYCKTLPPAAKLLFGEITALCSVQGYCWANNAYFMALYEVERYTVQRWLSALSKQGFIRVELVPGTGERRIYDLTIRPSNPPQKRDGGATKMSQTRHKKEAHSITENIKDINTLLARGGKFVGPGPVAARELTGHEQQGSASPPTIKSNPKKGRDVERAVARCGDLSARERFGKLWEVLEGYECVEVWQDGLDAAKTPVGRSTGILEAPTARFMSAVTLGLARRGVVLSGQAGPGGQGPEVGCPPGPAAA